MEKPISFLFVTVDGGGNVTPVLSLGRRLAERGHPVRVLTEPCLEQAEALGIPGVILFHMPEYLPGANRPPGGMGLSPATDTFHLDDFYFELLSQRLMLY